MIWVDSAVYKWRGKRWAHLMSDESVVELHAFASKIGLARSWFQSKGTPHYDVTEGKRTLALSRGALPASRAQTVRIIQHWREKKRAKR